MISYKLQEGYLEFGGVSTCRGTRDVRLRGSAPIRRPSVSLSMARLASCLLLMNTLMLSSKLGGACASKTKQCEAWLSCESLNGIVQIKLKTEETIRRETVTEIRIDQSRSKTQQESCLCYMYNDVTVLHVHCIWSHSLYYAVKMGRGIFENIYHSINQTPCPNE